MSERVRSSAICSWVDSEHVTDGAETEVAERDAAMRETVDDVHRVQSSVTSRLY